MQIRRRGARRPVRRVTQDLTGDEDRRRQPQDSDEECDDRTAHGGYGLADQFCGGNGGCRTAGWAWSRSKAITTEAVSHATPKNNCAFRARCHPMHAEGQHQLRPTVQVSSLLKPAGMCRDPPRPRVRRHLAFDIFDDVTRSLKGHAPSQADVLPLTGQARASRSFEPRQDRVGESSISHEMVNAMSGPRVIGSRVIWSAIRVLRSHRKNHS